MTRSSKQRATDLLLVLDAASVVAAKRANPGDVVFHKILFQAKLAAAERGFLAPHQGYKRWRHGPFSDEATQDEKLLKQLGLMTGQVATKRGREIVQHYRPLFAEGQPEVFEIMESSARKRATWNARDAMAECYAVPVERLGVDRSLGRVLRDLPKGTQFKLDRQDARDLTLDEDLVDDFLLDVRLSEDDLRASRHIAFSGTTAELEAELDL